jgi:hypothetical protein
MGTRSPSRRPLTLIPPPRSGLIDVPDPQTFPGVTVEACSVGPAQPDFDWQQPAWAPADTEIAWIELPDTFGRVTAECAGTAAEISSNQTFTRATYVSPNEVIAAGLDVQGRRRLYRLDPTNVEAGVEAWNALGEASSPNSSGELLAFIRAVGDEQDLVVRHLPSGEEVVVDRVSVAQGESLLTPSVVVLQP